MSHFCHVSAGVNAEIGATMPWRQASKLGPLLESSGRAGKVARHFHQVSVCYWWCRLEHGDWTLREAVPLIGSDLSRLACLFALQLAASIAAWQALRWPFHTCFDLWKEYWSRSTRQAGLWSASFRHSRSAPRLIYALQASRLSATRHGTAMARWLQSGRKLN